MYFYTGSKQAFNAGEDMKSNDTIKHISTEKILYSKIAHERNKKVNE